MTGAVFYLVLTSDAVGVLTPQLQLQHHKGTDDDSGHWVAISPGETENVACRDRELER